MGNRYLVTYDGARRLMHNVNVRKVSPTVKLAWERLQRQEINRSGGCSKCGRHRIAKKTVENLRNALRTATDQMEIERIKAILQVKQLVFHYGSKEVIR